MLANRPMLVPVKHPNYLWEWLYCHLILTVLQTKTFSLISLLLPPPPSLLPLHSLSHPHCRCCQATLCYCDHCCQSVVLGLGQGWFPPASVWYWNGGLPVKTLGWNGAHPESSPYHPHQKRERLPPIERLHCAAHCLLASAGHFSAMLLFFGLWL